MQQKADKEGFSASLTTINTLCADIRNVTFINRLPSKNWWPGSTDELFSFQSDSDVWYFLLRVVWFN